MIPVLYKPNETDFSTHGLGLLSAATECKVTEQINDSYELSMSYPVDGIHFKDIRYGCIIKAEVPDGSEQLFQVYSISDDYPNSTINAEHISYRTNGIIVRPFSAGTASSAMSGLKNNSINSNPFTMRASLSESGDYKCESPASIKSQLEQILKVFGGELYYDNYSINLIAQRGQKRNVTLRYGKNIVSLKQEQNIQETYSGVVGYWKGSVNDNDTTVVGNIVNTASPIPTERVMVLDVSSNLDLADDTVPTAGQIDAQVSEYISKNKPGVPKISLEIDMASLWQTDEYKDLAPIEKIELGDTVTVIFDQLGISEDTRAVKIEWDVINERNSTVTFGEVARTYADDVKEQKQAIQDTADEAAANDEELSEQIESTKSDLGLQIKQTNDSLNIQAKDIKTLQNGQTEMSTSISVNAEKIETQAKQITTIDGKQTTLESSITQQAGEIAMKVSKDGVINAINLSTEGATIDASKINLTGYVTVSSLSTPGTTTIDGSNITTGTIEADHIGKTIGGNTYRCLTEYSLIDDSGSGLRKTIRDLADEEIKKLVKSTSLS